jgi:hypothetical protein
LINTERLMKSINKMLSNLMGLFLIAALVLPVSPVFAGMSSSDLKASPSKHCSEKMRMNSNNPNIVLAEKGSMNQEHAACKKENHSDDTCTCNNPCQQLSASTSSTFLSTQENISFPRLDRATLAFQFVVSPLKNQYLPTLRPPIC